MRDPDRIDEFMQRLHDIWRQECPDWRFGQLIFNVFNQLDFDPFMMEDNQMLYEFERYFNLVDKSEDPIAVHKDLLISQTYRHKKKGGPRTYDSNREGRDIISKRNSGTKQANREKECRRRTKHKNSI